MLSQWQHVSGITLAFAGMSFAASFGSEETTIFAYLLAVVFGGIVYLQGDKATIAATVTGNILIGYFAGIVLSLVVATSLLIWFLNIPLDFGLWQMSLLMWDSWGGIGVAVLSGFFFTGLTVSFA